MISYDYISDELKTTLIRIVEWLLILAQFCPGYSTDTGAIIQLPQCELLQPLKFLVRKSHGVTKNENYGNNKTKYHQTYIGGIAYQSSVDQNKITRHRNHCLQSEGTKWNELAWNEVHKKNIPLQ